MIEAGKTCLRKITGALVDVRRSVRIDGKARAAAVADVKSNNIRSAGRTCLYGPAMDGSKRDHEQGQHEYGKRNVFHLRNIINVIEASQLEV
jgi:hypothetical protein